MHIFCHNCFFVTIGRLLDVALREWEGSSQERIFSTLSKFSRKAPRFAHFSRQILL